jgi:hypothetical protein
MILAPSWDSYSWSSSLFDPPHSRFRLVEDNYIIKVRLSISIGCWFCTKDGRGSHIAICINARNKYKNILGIPYKVKHKTLLQNTPRGSSWGFGTFLFLVSITISFPHLEVFKKHVTELIVKKVFKSSHFESFRKWWRTSGF